MSHGFTCVPHPDPPSHLPLHLIPLGLPSAPGSRTLWEKARVGCFERTASKHVYYLGWNRWHFNKQFSSVAQSCPTLCQPMNCSTPGFPVHNQLPELDQTHVYQVSDAIRPSHPLPSPSPPAPNPSQHQGLFQWVSSMHQVAKVLEFQQQSFQWIFRTDFLEDGLVGSPCSPRDSQESSPTPLFKNINSSALSFPYESTVTLTLDYWKNYCFD